MKIAVIGSKGIPAEQGGIEQYCQELYKNIVAQGHTVKLYARCSYTKEYNKLSPYYCHGIEVISLPSIPIKSIDVIVNSLVAALVSTIGNHDIIHFHALGPSLFCWIPRFFCSAKIVVTCHGLDWQRAKWSRLGSFIIYCGERVAITCANELIVVSQELQTYFCKKYGIKATYIPTAPAKYVNSDAASSYIDSISLEKGSYILFLGRLVPEKRPDLLLKAFKLLDPSGWKLVFVGDTSDTDKFKLQLVAEKNDNIIFTNTLTGSPLADIVRNAGLFVLPSDLEGLPLVILEAMREGIPVLASDIPPHRQLVGKDRGWLFKAGDLKSLMSNLEKLLSGQVDLDTRVLKAQEYVKNNCNWKKVTYQNMVLYGKLSKLLTNKDQAKALQAQSSQSKNK